MKSTRDQIVASDFIAPAPAGDAFKGVQTMEVYSDAIEAVLAQMFMAARGIATAETDSEAEIWGDAFRAATANIANRSNLSITELVDMSIKSVVERLEH